MTSKAKENIYGRIIKSTKEAGIIIKCLVKANIGGQMADTMRVNIKMIKSTAMVNSSGQTAESTKEPGRTENNTAKDFSLIKMV